MKLHIKNWINVAGVPLFKNISSAFSVQTLFHTTLSIIKLPLLLLLSSLGQKRHKGKLSAAGKKRYQLTFHSENPELKSVNLQYITLGCWADGTNESSTKRLIFQVWLFFSPFLVKCFAKIISIYYWLWYLA